MLRSLGYRVREGAHVYARTQYLAGTDRQRAADVNAMFADPGVQAIFTLRGGYGTMRTLPYLDYDLVAQNPKVVIGYSDISGLLFGLHARTGLVGFHGPCATSTFSEYTLAEYKKVVADPRTGAVIAAPPAVDYPEGRAERRNRITTFIGGRARGPLIGGNLSLLSPLIGTPYAPDFNGAILFLEDVNEAWYRIDRMLTHLLLAGKLQQLAGIVLGKWLELNTENPSGHAELLHRLADLVPQSLSRLLTFLTQLSGQEKIVAAGCGHLSLQFRQGQIGVFQLAQFLFDLFQPFRQTFCIDPVFTRHIVDRPHTLYHLL